MESRAKIKKSEEKQGNGCICWSRSVQVTVFRHPQTYLFLLRKIFLLQFLHIWSGVFHIAGPTHAERERETHKNTQEKISNLLTKSHSLIRE